MFSPFRNTSPVIWSLRRLASETDYTRQVYTTSGGNNHLLRGVLSHDPVLFAIMVKFEGVPTFLKFDPYTFTNWHTDLRRSCAVNVLLEGNAHTIFTETVNNGEPIMRVKELKYEEARPYLLDTQKLHAVLNLNQPRYVFSLGIYHDIASYEQVRDWCEKEGVLS